MLLECRKKFQETYGVIDVESGYADGANIKPLYEEIIKEKIDLMQIIMQRL